MSLDERVKELRRLAKREGVADQVGNMPDVEMATRAYADVLGLNIALVASTDLTLAEIRTLS